MGLSSTVMMDKERDIGADLFCSIFVWFSSCFPFASEKMYILILSKEETEIFKAKLHRNCNDRVTTEESRPNLY